jgi:hypothetical protein
MTEKICPECNGEGIVDQGTEDERRCPTCNGSGIVPDDGQEPEEVWNTRVIGQLLFWHEDHHAQPEGMHDFWRWRHLTAENSINRCSVNSCDFCECLYTARSLHLRTEQSKIGFNVEFFIKTKLLSQHSPEAKGAY